MTIEEKDIKQFQTVSGNNLLAEIGNFVSEPMLIVTMEDLLPLFMDKLPKNANYHIITSLEKEDLENDLDNLKGYSSIIGLGGGQAIDVAKYFSWRLNKPLFQFPTSLSVDAVFGHRSGIRENGIVKYVGWAIPETIYIDFGIIKNAPHMLNIAGVGDIFCFFTGAMDWKFAHDKNKCEAKWPYDQSLAQISLDKAEKLLDGIEHVKLLDEQGISLMIDALKWGGASYHGAGWCPRHVEGVEHYIFYALEAYTGKKFLHGQAVCLGLVIGCEMHNQRAYEMLCILVSLGLDIRPEAMNISWEDVSNVLFKLKEFCIEQEYPYGIANEFEVTQEFVDKIKSKIEKEYNR